MARKIIRVSDRSGQEIPDGKGATVRITFQDQRKGVRELDLPMRKQSGLVVAQFPAEVAGPVLGRQQQQATAPSRECHAD